MTSQRPPSISTFVPLRRSVTLIIFVPSSDWLNAAPPARVDPGGRREPAALAGQQGPETGQCTTAAPRGTAPAGAGLLRAGERSARPGAHSSSTVGAIPAAVTSSS